MKSLGLAVRIRTTLLIIILTATSFITTTQALTPASNPIRLETAIDLLTATIKDFSSLNYYTATKIDIALGGINHSITIDWKFGGSGHLFTALPTVPVEIKQQQSPGAKNTLKVLGDTLIKLATHKTKDKVTFLRWISSAKISPIKLFCLKLLLLTKYAYKKNALDVFQKELFRLLVRLSLTDNTSIDTTKPLSSHFPELIKQYITTIFPQGLDILDSLWEALISHDTHLDVDTLSEIKTLQTFVFNDEETAKKCFEGIKQQQKIDDFSSTVKSYLVKQGYDICSYTSFLTLCQPKPKKQAWLDKLLANAGKQNNANPLLHTINKAQTLIAQKTFASSDKDLPKPLQRVAHDRSISLVAGKNRWWIVNVSDELDITTTLSYISTCLMSTLKKYASQKQAYFKKHPSQARDMQKSYEEKQKRKHTRELFLQTEEGIASQQRIEQQCAQINKIALTTSTPHISPEKKHEAEVLSREIAELENNLVLFKKLFKSNSKNKKLENIIKDLLAKITSKKTILNKLTATSTPQKEKLQKHIDRLVDLIEKVKNQKKEVPAFLQKNLELLKQELKQQEKKPQPNPSLDDKIKCREQEANIYTREALKIEKLRNKKLSDILTIADPIEQKIELMDFKALQEDEYNAYIADLQEKANTLIEENKKMKILDASRSLLMGDNHTDEDKAKAEQLEREVGHLIDGERQSFFASLLCGDTELKQVARDLLTPHYKALKNNLFDSLTHIISRCNHFKKTDYKIMYEGLIEAFIPEFLETFKTLTA